MTSRGWAPTCFISYASRDWADAEIVAQALARTGIVPAIDRDLVRMRRRAVRVLGAALDEVTAIVLVLTPETTFSPWVQAEVARAQRRRVPLFVIRTTPCGVPGWAARARVVDATTDLHAGAGQLAAVVGRTLRRSPAFARRLRPAGLA